MLDDPHLRGEPTGFGIDGEVAVGDEFLEPASAAFRRGFAEEQRDGVEMLDTDLRIQVEFAEGFDLVVEKLEAHGQRVVKGEDIENAAADGELAACRDLRHVLVSGLGELLEQLVAVQARGAAQAQFELLERGGRGDFILQAASREHDDLPALRAGQALHDAEPFRDAFRVGQRAFDRGAVQLRKEQRIGKPLEQLVVHRLLGADVRAHDPHAGFRLPHEQRGEKRLRRGDHVFERHGLALLDTRQLRRERRCGGDQVEWVGWGFHERGHPLAHSPRARKYGAVLTKARAGRSGRGTRRRRIPGCRRGSRLCGSQDRRAP